MTAALEGGEWSAESHGRNLPPRERPGTHFTGGWVGPQGRSGRAENLVPTGNRSRTVQPVAQSPYRLSYQVYIFLNYIRLYFQRHVSAQFVGPSSGRFLDRWSVKFMIVIVI